MNSVLNHMEILTERTCEDRASYEEATVEQRYRDMTPPGILWEL